MPSISIPVVKEAVLYGDGNSLLGRVKEFELPEIEYEFYEHEAVGMKGVVELYMNVQAMEATFTFYYSPDVIRLVANPMRSVSLQVRANLDTYNSSGTSTTELVAFVRGRFKKVPMGEFVQNENVELECEMAVDAVKLSIGGEEMYEIDVPAGIQKSGGVDILSQLTSLIRSLVQ